MKKLMVLMVFVVAALSVNATGNKVKTVPCNYVVVYPCPGNPITTGCFETYEQAAAYLALNPTIICPAP